jgi:predicted GIY-YIG superfamily endonuclease
MNAYVYILRCRDGRYYVGTTRGSLEQRIAEHNAGTFGGFTKSRRPVQLVYSESFERITDGIASERKLLHAISAVLRHRTPYDPQKLFKQTLPA